MSHHPESCRLLVHRRRQVLRSGYFNISIAQFGIRSELLKLGVVVLARIRLDSIADSRAAVFGFEIVKPGLSGTVLAAHVFRHSSLRKNIPMMVCSPIWMASEGWPQWHLVEILATTSLDAVSLNEHFTTTLQGSLGEARNTDGRSSN